MLKLPNLNLNSIKLDLLKRKKTVEREIEELANEDPVMVQGVAESSEPGTDSFQADVHARIVAARTNLSLMAQKIQKALNNLARGDYGKCDVCGKSIETPRLLIMPFAHTCLSCSRKNSK